MQNELRRVVLVTAAVVLSLAAYAQDIILTTDAKKIEAKITEVTKSEIRYKEKDYLDGPTFFISTDEINSIIYGNGKVVLYNQPAKQEIAQPAQPFTLEPKQLSIEENNTSQAKQTNKSNCQSSDTVYSAYEFQGGTLPKFTYTKVHVPGKKYPKNRYVGGNMVLTSSEFLKFLQLYCPEAYAYQRKANIFLTLECISILFGIIPVAIFAALCISNSSKVLPTYNGSCAGHHVAVIEINPQHYYHDQVQLATIVP